MTFVCVLSTTVLLLANAAVALKLPFLQSSSALAGSARKLTVPDDFKVPEPKPLSVADGNYAGAISGTIALAWRLGSGVFAVGWKPVAEANGENEWPGTLGVLRDGSSVLDDAARPSKPIVIYEYEASPFCRKVREACSMLDLEVEYRPCPGARSGWSDTMASAQQQRRTVPYMEDGKVKMFESDDIIEYLFDTYGPGKEAIPWVLKGDFARITATYAAAARDFAGSRLQSNARADATSFKPITLYGYEGSPFVRPVREALSSLGLAHVMINCPRGSRNRDMLYQKTGRFQVPYIEDPNTGINMFESGEIVKYLQAVYTTDTTSD